MSQLPRPKRNFSHSTSTPTIRISHELKENLVNISNLLNTNLTPEVIEICIQLCDAGVHPQALAQIIQKIRKEVEEKEKL